MFLAVVISLFIFSQGYAALQCPTNEIYDACGNACEPTCKDPHPILCLPSCFAGCKCKDGFFRDANNECVKTCTEYCADTRQSELRIVGTTTNPQPNYGSSDHVIPSSPDMDLIVKSLAKLASWRILNLATFLFIEDGETQTTSSSASPKRDVKW